MRLHILSDLHLDFHQDGGQEFLRHLNPDSIDVLVLAGDIVNMVRPAQASTVLNLLSRLYPQVVFVPGNHEFYGTTVQNSLGRLESITGSLSNFHWLKTGEPLVIDCRRFLGDTMWFQDTLDSHLYRHFLNDFTQIGGFEPWVYEQNGLFEHYLNGTLREGDIVVTHHLPSPACISPQYKKSALNRYFVHDMSSLIRKRKPALWIYGHTHSPADIKIGKTRVVSNPMGYPTEQEKVYEPLVIELPTCK